MNKSDERAAVLLFGLWLVSRAAWPALKSRAKAAVRAAANAPANALQRGGARVYDVVHDDAGHKQDLPGHQLTRQAVLQIATKAGFRDPKLASAIAFAESGGVPGAVARSSREVSVGLWQINTRAHPTYSVDAMKDPAANAAAAFALSRGGTDWRSWTQFANGNYRKFQTGIFAP